MLDNVVTMPVFDIINFVASLVSLIFALFAIWMAWQLKLESDRVNKETRDLLLEIRTDAKVVAQVAMPELKAYGELSRQVIGQAASMKVDMTTAPESELKQTPSPSGS